MASRRLTKIQKAEIVEGYRSGEGTNVLAEKYECSPNTINRTVKTFLSESEYKLIKEKRLKASNKKKDMFDNQIVENMQIDVDQEESSALIDSLVKDEAQSINISEDSLDSELTRNLPLALEDAEDFGDHLSSESQINNIDKNNQDSESNFEEIVPLISNFDFELEKLNSDFKILPFQSLPESVYMLVDKKVELDSLLISDLPEWSFLPDHELKRNAILLFNNQRSAKRICSRTQRVIKIPNTKVFNISKSYLISKGITRLILEDSIIALDN